MGEKNNIHSSIVKVWKREISIWSRSYCLAEMRLLWSNGKDGELTGGDGFQSLVLLHKSFIARDLTGPAHFGFVSCTGQKDLILNVERLAQVAD